LSPKYRKTVSQDINRITVFEVRQSRLFPSLRSDDPPNDPHISIRLAYAKRNPTSDFKPSDVLKSAHKVNYARVDAKELPSLFRAIEVYQGTHVTRLTMKIMALSFVRTSELIGARWEEFDIPDSRWNIPAERTKMRTPHIVPLATQTIEALEMLKELICGSEWLFPGDRNPKRPMSNNTILGALKRMGYQGLMTGHGFRGLASTILHEQGYVHEHIELQLAHAPRNAVSAAYNHALYLDPRSRMMQDWADFAVSTTKLLWLMSFQPASSKSKCLWESWNSEDLSRMRFTCANFGL
jgi:integrase